MQFKIISILALVTDAKVAKIIPSFWTLKILDIYEQSNFS